MTDISHERYVDHPTHYLALVEIRDLQNRITELEAAVEVAAALPSSPAAVRVLELETTLKDIEHWASEIVARIHLVLEDK